MKKQAKSVLIAAAGILLSAGLLFAAGCGSRQKAQKSEEPIADVIEARIDLSTIPEGIFIGDVDVGGMTSSQAEAAIRSYVEEIAQQPVILAANDEILKTTVTELGFTEDVDSTIDEALGYGKTGNVLRRYKKTKDLELEEQVLPLALTADEEQVTEYLEENTASLNVSAVDYGLSRVNGEFVIEEGHAGQAIDIDASAQKILSCFLGGWQENTTIYLDVDVIEPKGSYEELALVQDVLGKYSTDYSTSGSARKTNIMVGANCIDGSIIYPGETFSVEAAVTPFTAEHGYEEAPSYESGATVDSYGGGICQVSTTLYNALIRAELEIVERHGHSMTVSYVDPSADAAIAEGIKDLKFTNNTDAPIYLSAYTDGATISFTVYGHETRPANRSVSFVSETTETVDPTVEYKASSEASFGSIELVQSAHSGKKSELWKVITVDGVEESREVFNTTTYEMSPTIYEVGVSTDDGAAQSAMYDAISSQDSDRIYAVIAQYASGTSSEPEPEEEEEEEEETPEETGAESSGETAQPQSDPGDSADGGGGETGSVSDGTDDSGGSSDHEAEEGYDE